MKLPLQVVQLFAVVPLPVSVSFPKVIGPKVKLFPLMVPLMLLAYNPGEAVPGAPIAVTVPLKVLPV
jgi:hypothetical protein